MPKTGWERGVGEGGGRSKFPKVSVCWIGVPSLYAAPASPSPLSPSLSWYCKSSVFWQEAQNSYQELYDQTISDVSTTLHYTTLHFSTPYYTTLHYMTLHYTLHYTTLYYTILYYNISTKMLTFILCKSVYVCIYVCMSVSAKMSQRPLCSFKCILRGSICGNTAACDSLLWRWRNCLINEVSNATYGNR